MCALTLAKKMTAEITDERFPVWEVLSEFFLDTELQEQDYDRIATTLAATDYSTAEIKEILDYEVSPACKWNLYSIAGEWAGFHPDWIMETIAPRKDKRPRIRLPQLSCWMFRSHWKSVVPRINAIRKTKNG